MSDVLSIERSVVDTRMRMVTEEITMQVNDPMRELGKFEQRFLYYRYGGLGACLAFYAPFVACRAYHCGSMVALSFCYCFHWGWVRSHLVCGACA